MLDLTDTQILSKKNEQTKESVLRETNVQREPTERQHFKKKKKKKAVNYNATSQCFNQIYYLEGVE